jgi:hypothetical protein
VNIGSITIFRGKAYDWLRVAFNIEKVFTDPHHVPTPRRRFGFSVSTNSLHASVPFAKCIDHATYELHLAHFLKLRDDILGFYREMKWRRFRWKIRIRLQKAYDQLAQEFSEGAANTNGGGRFNHASKGHPSTPNKHIFIELKRLCTGRPSEYRTSKVCSNCTYDLEDTRFWAIKQFHETTFLKF